MADLEPMVLSRRCLREELADFAENELRALFASELRRLIRAPPKEEFEADSEDPSPRSAIPRPSLASESEAGTMCAKALPRGEQALAPTRTRTDGHGMTGGTPQFVLEDIAAMSSTGNGGLATKALDAAGRSYSFIEKEVDTRCNFSRLERFESSRFFNSVAALVIFVNVVVMVVTAEYLMNNPGKANTSFLVRCEWAFVIAYSAELSIRLLAKRLRFFSSGWGWFDLLIVAAGLFETLAQALEIIDSDNARQVQVLRTLRMLKILRVVRLLRSIREVRLLLDALMASLRPLLWTILLVFSVSFMLALLFVNAAAAFVSDSSGVDPLVQDEVLHLWGSMLRSMYTLLLCATSGMDWREAADVLHGVGWQYFLVFILYILFFFYAVTNSVCAIFVEAAAQYAMRDQGRLMQEQLAKRKKYMGMMVEIFSHLDTDGSGTLNKAEFHECMRDPRMGKFANALELDIMDLEHFFEVISVKGTQEVGLEAFVEGCIRLRGLARSMDVVEISTMQKQMFKDLSKVKYLIKEFQTELAAACASPAASGSVLRRTLHRC